MGLNAPRDSVTGRPMLVRVPLTGIGLREDDPLIISDTEEEPATPSFSSQHRLGGSSGRRIRRQARVTNVFPALGGPEDQWAQDTSSPCVTLEDEQAAYRCSICLGLETHPVTTQCGRTFCLVCVRLALEKSFLCPLCKKIIQYPPRTVIDAVNMIDTAFSPRA
ncbi:hypothetical protein B0H13DRAFT_2311312 [Mycena leptocephala]|nr:hypothetical protein B0H13DRAFT_2311312 [Mycena leptocephala]